MDIDTTFTVWDYLERENPHAPHTQSLYSWGLNCNRDANPFTLFLDLIGWSDEHYGERFAPSGSLGYMELGHLADALNEYTNDPERVRSWVDGLMSCEEV